MRKYIGTSILLHLLIFLITLGGNGTSEIPNTAITGVDVLTEQTQYPPVEQIKELATGGNGEEAKDFYWGLGISSTDAFDISTGSYQYTVTAIVIGYNGDKSGLKVDDRILLINGSPITNENSVRGDGPREMILTVLRNGVIILIKTERGKVYY